MYNWINVDRQFFVPDDTYKKLVEHQVFMNQWTFPDDHICKPKEGNFTIADAFIDLIGKGFIKYYDYN